MCTNTHTQYLPEEKELSQGLHYAMKLTVPLREMALCTLDTNRKIDISCLASRKLRKVSGWRPRTLRGKTKHPECWEWVEMFPDRVHMYPCRTTRWGPEGSCYKFLSVLT